MTSLRILREVYQDAAEAANWYDENQPGLGDRFLNCVRETYPPIRANPFAYRLVYKSYRKVTLHPFPYAVYFRLQEETAVVVLIFHSARNPTSLRRILRSREKSN